MCRRPAEHLCTTWELVKSRQRHTPGTERHDSLHTEGMHVPTICMVIILYYFVAVMVYICGQCVMAGVHIALSCLCWESLAGFLATIVSSMEIKLMCALEFSWFKVGQRMAYKTRFKWVILLAILQCFKAIVWVTGRDSAWTSTATTIPEVSFPGHEVTLEKRASWATYLCVKLIFVSVCTCVV